MATYPGGVRKGIGHVPYVWKIRGKISFMRHQCYLPENYVWHRNKLYNGKEQHRPPPIVMNGHDILEQLDSLVFSVMSKHLSLKDNKRKRALN